MKLKEELKAANDQSASLTKQNNLLLSQVDTLSAKSATLQKQINKEVSYSFFLHFHWQN